jgi:hypothetical protein
LKLGLAAISVLGAAGSMASTAGAGVEGVSAVAVGVAVPVSVAAASVAVGLAAAVAAGVLDSSSLVQAAARRARPASATVHRPRDASIVLIDIAF